MVHTKQWRDIDAETASRVPRSSRANHETVVRRAPAELVAEATKLELVLQPLRVPPERTLLPPAEHCSSFGTFFVIKEEEVALAPGKG